MKVKRKCVGIKNSPHEIKEKLCMFITKLISRSPLCQEIIHEFTSSSIKKYMKNVQINLRIVKFDFFMSSFCLTINAI